MKYNLKFLYWIEKIEEILIRISILAIFLLVSLQVFCRYVLNNSLFWPPEIARLALVWTTFFGASYALKKGMHIQMRALVNKFSPRVRQIIQIFIYFVMIVVLIFLIVYGMKLFVQFLPTRLSGTPISLAYLFLPIPISSFFMFFACIDLLIGAFSKENSVKEKN